MSPFVCPWHGYEYALKDGECVRRPSAEAEEIRRVRRGDDIFVVANQSAVATSA